MIWDSAIVTKMIATAAMDKTSHCHWCHVIENEIITIRVSCSTKILKRNYFTLFSYSYVQLANVLFFVRLYDSLSLLNVFSKVCTFFHFCQCVFFGLVSLSWKRIINYVVWYCYTSPFCSPYSLLYEMIGMIFFSSQKIVLHFFVFGSFWCNHQFFTL